MVSRSVRKTVIRTVFVAVCVLGIAGGVPAIAGVVESDARFSTPIGDGELPEPQAPGMVVAPEVGSALALSVRDRIGGNRHVMLNCRPAGGNHPAPRKACDQLRAAGGEVSEIPAEAGACTAEYAPVTVMARGAWRGKEHAYQRVFGNRCEAIRKTGGVLFNF